jgi:hypothetical protein
MKKYVSPMFLALALGLGGVWTPPSEAKAGSSPLVARLTLANGRAQTVTLEGVGCSETICSRVAVRTRGEGESGVTSTWLDTIAAITDITPGAAVFVLKDGTSRRLSVQHDNQFLYFVGQTGAEGKIDMAGLKSVEFPASGR